MTIKVMTPGCTCTIHLLLSVAGFEHPSIEVVCIELVDGACWQMLTVLCTCRLACEQQAKQRPKQPNVHSQHD